MRTLRTAVGLLALTAAFAVGGAGGAALAVGGAESAPAGSVADAVAGLENALRYAIERQPEGLLKSVTAAERVCEVGERAEAGAEGDAAAADWSALAQLVGAFAEPELASVRRALGEARRELTRAQRSLRAAWSGQRRRLRALTGAAGSVRRGIDRVIGSLAALQSAFAAWRERDCEAALAASATSDRRARGGVEAIAIGIQRLAVLSR